MTIESLCFNVGADAVASNTVNTFARSFFDRSLDGKQCWETYRAATRIATIEASPRRHTEVFKHVGSNFAKLETSREEGVKRKLEEAIASTTNQHRIFKRSSGWLRCYDCPGRAKPDNRDYWSGKPCAKMHKRQRTGPSAEHFKLWEYVLSNPVDNFDLGEEDLSSGALEQDEPDEYQECQECQTSTDFTTIFFCNACKMRLCVSCGSYGLEDHQCGFCLFSHCLDCRGDHVEACMRQAAISETTQSVPGGSDSSVLTMGSGISHACVTNASSSEDRGGLSEPKRKRIITKRGEALARRNLT